MDNLLPQKFMVQLINQGGETTVQRLPLDQNQTGSLDVNLAAGDKARIGRVGHHALHYRGGQFSVCDQIVAALRPSRFRLQHGPAPRERPRPAGRPNDAAPAE